jgi:hypothetical protein
MAISVLKSSAFQQVFQKVLLRKNLSKKNLKIFQTLFPLIRHISMEVAMLIEEFYAEYFEQLEGYASPDFKGIASWVCFSDGSKFALSYQNPVKPEEVYTWDWQSGGQKHCFRKSKCAIWTFSNRHEITISYSLQVAFQCNRANPSGQAAF